MKYQYQRIAPEDQLLRASDVCLSCRGARKDHDSQQAVAAWQPTRLEWSYLLDPAFIASVRERGAVFVGTLNTIHNHGPAQDCEGFDGQRLVAPWMTSFEGGKGVGWSCVNKPATYLSRLDRLKILLAQGVRTIQYDDWFINLSAYLWGGGCFCAACRKGFSEYLARNATAADRQAAGRSSWDNFDYQMYLREKFGWKTIEELKAGRERDPLDRHFRQFSMVCTREYFEKLLAAGAELAGAPLTLTVNATMDEWQFARNFLLDRVAYLVGETHVGPDTEDKLIVLLKTADALRLPQIVSPFPAFPDHKLEVDAVRRHIALAYALGHRLLIPWDVWQGPHTQERWYGTPAEYGELYEFVRSNARLLDGYRPCADVALILKFDEAAANRGVLNGQARPLVMRWQQQGILARLALFGQAAGMVAIPVEPEDFQGVQAAAWLENPAGLPPAERAEIERAVQSTPVWAAEKIEAAPSGEKLSAGKIAPSFRTDAPKLLVFPRRKSDPAAPTVVHLINLDRQPLKTAELWLAGRLWDNRPLTGVILHQPGRSAQALPFHSANGGIALACPELAEWGLLELRR